MLHQVLPLFVITILLLAYYVYQDMKYREINILPIFVISLFSVIYLLIFVFRDNVLLWTQYFTQIIFTFVFILIIFLFGKITKFAYIGEGDLLIVMLIAFTSSFVFAFSQLVFLLALFLMLLIPMFFLVYNLINKNYPEYNLINNFLLMLLGTKKKINKITDFYTPLELLKYKNDKIVKELQLTPNCSPKEQIEEITMLAKKTNIKEIWVSPLIPFIIALAVSYVILTLFLYFGILSKYGLFLFI